MLVFTARVASITFFLKNLGKYMKITSMGSAVSVLVLEDESGAR